MTLPDINDTKKGYRISAKLRSKRKRGKQLTAEETAWLSSYEAAHPSPRTGAPHVQSDGGAASFAGNGVAKPAQNASSSVQGDATSFPTSSGAGSGPPPIDLSGAAPSTAGGTGPSVVGGAAPTLDAAAHDRECEALAAQFCFILKGASDKIVAAGGQGISDTMLNVMIGPSAKRLLLKHMPQGGDSTSYLDWGVVLGGVAYVGYQGVLVARKTREIAQTETQFRPQVQANQPTVPVRAEQAQPKERGPIPNDLGPLMPTARIDPSTAGDDEELQRKPARDTGRGNLTA